MSWGRRRQLDVAAPQDFQTLIGQRPACHVFDELVEAVTRMSIDGGIGVEGEAVD